MKLWDKAGTSIDARVEAFTAGDDVLLDQALVPYDCVASQAHARMLAGIGILTDDELEALLAGLDAIIARHAAGDFVVRPEDEDCHTAIESYLTEHCGEAGKKIHTARSRNDQVLTAMRLFEKDALAQIDTDIEQLLAAIEGPRQRFGEIQLPGWTHTRKAMPATIDAWFEAYAAGLTDDRRLVAAVAEVIDQSPLGSAAGFGLPIAIDREATARELGFARVQPALYCQPSRGKLEGALIDALGQVMLDLNRMACDLILFSSDSFGFFRLPAAVCTGSSIMPQKHNPDVLELIRASHAAVLGASLTIKTVSANLISGYHRDLQLTKGPTMRALRTTADCLEMMRLTFDGLEVDRERCAAAMTDELFATERAYALVAEGVPFRDAYRKIGEEYA